jgi:transposase
VHDRHDLSDEQWALLEPHLRRSTPGRAGRRWADHRTVINAVMWRTRSGSTWRDVPSSYGPWKTVYNRHRLWSADGTWDVLLKELQRGSDVQANASGSWDVGIDSTVIRAHQHAAGAPHAAPGDVSAERLAVALDDFESRRSKHYRAPDHTGGWVELHETGGRGRGYTRLNRARSSAQAARP